MELTHIIVPISNLADHLENFENWVSTIGSRNIKIIVVHDISDERTGHILRVIIAKYSQLAIHLEEGNFGSPGFARNAGLNQVSGTGWVAFWDGDDFARVDNFLEMLELADRDKKEIAVGGFEIVDLKKSKKFPHSVRLLEGPDYFNEISLFPGIWRWAFRLERLRRTRFSNYPMGEDQEFLAALNINETEVFFYKKCVYKYYKNRHGQLTSNKYSTTQLIHTINESFKQPNFYSNRLGQLFFVRQMITILIKGKFKQKFNACIFLSLFIRKNRSALVTIISLSRDLLGITKALLRRQKTMRFYLFGGLGNQLFQLKAAIEKSNGAPVILDASLLTQSQIENAELIDFKLPSNVYPVFTTAPTFLNRRILNLCIRLSTRTSRNSMISLCIGALRQMLTAVLRLRLGGSWFINRGVGEDSRIARANSSKYLGYFQFASRDYLGNPSIFDLELINKSQEFENLKIKIENKRNLILQVRMGYYLTEDKFGHLENEYFETQLRAALDYTKFDAIYLFSDNPELAVDRFPASLRARIELLDSQNLKSSEVLELMRYGTYYIISNSTFGWWGAFLSYFPNPRVIVPNPWFSLMQTPENLIPSSWNLMHRDGIKFK